MDSCRRRALVVLAVRPSPRRATSCGVSFSGRCTNSVRCARGSQAGGAGLMAATDGPRRGPRRALTEDEILDAVLALARGEWLTLTPAAAEYPVRRLAA